jgi:hypothetical protein
MADKTNKSETVLVPPAGIHTPGTTAMGGESPYIEVPADGDAEATREAVLKAQKGDYDAALPAGVIPVNPDGSAMTPAAADQAVKDEQQHADELAGKATPPAKPKG